MSQNSRRGFLLSLTVPLAISAAACTQAPDSQKVADRFMEFYYVQISVKDAVALSNGLAKEKLQGQLKLMEGVGTEPSADKPKVTFSLVSHKADSEQEATYVYSVNTHVEELGKRLVYVKVRSEAGASWMVTQFTEQDALP
jgi:hypothetical protein